ncbi:MAG: proline--tRNA ligase [Alphaproteobacteria bacterium]|nr:proline--tRNA ligase [Alphaproteobacteria bacterium]
MRLTSYFLPTTKETPSEASVISHKLMLRTGMIYQTAAGIYSWLPLGLRVLRKIEQIVREEQDAAGAHEVLLPTIQPLELWAEGGRPDAMGKETLRMKDRHDREMLYAPTAEEVVTDVFRKHVFSYRNLPCMLYQIQWKFRDEIRPRFGVMRGREFYMKDCYSFDIDETSARVSYAKMFEAYLRTFKRMGMVAVPVKADTGAIGGSLSHEFQILADTGESQIYYDKALDDLRSADISAEKLMNIYAAADEMHEESNCPVAPADLRTARGIEVGHVFYLGTKYSDMMKAKVADKDGQPTIVHMGCYGIGVSRIVAAIIEASHDEQGIIWPMSVTPYHVGIINLRQGDSACDAACEQFYQQMQDIGIEALYDDRNERAGVKFADMDLIGLPWQLIIGPKGLEAGTVEIKNRSTGIREDVKVDEVMEILVNHMKDYI